MNVTDFRVTPMSQVHASVEKLAHEHGTSIAEGELIGLIPEAACQPNCAWTEQIPDFNPDLKILERRLAQPQAWPEA